MLFENRLLKLMKLLCGYSEWNESSLNWFFFLLHFQRFQSKHKPKQICHIRVQFYGGFKPQYLRYLPWPVFVAVCAYRMQRKENTQKEQHHLRKEEKRLQKPASSTPHTLFITFLYIWVKLIIQNLISYIFVVIAYRQTCLHHLVC